MTTLQREVMVHLRTPHSYQTEFIHSPAKRKVIRAGRRSGKTVGVAILAVQKFLEGHRVLYATPTSEQLTKFWYEVCRALQEPIDAGLFVKNETESYIEKAHTETRLRAKTAWNANTLRGDFADELILDEFQLMAEDTWDEVGAPMLLDNNGDAIFVYTPPSLYSSGVSRSRDPRHAAKMFKKAQSDKTGEWASFHWTSHDNPYISQEALITIAKDMSKASYLREILAEDDETSANILVYSAFNEKVCKVARFEIPSQWPRYSGHDFGSANPAALFFAQDPATGYFYVYQEYLPGAGQSTWQNVQEFKKLTESGRVIKRVGGNKTTEEEIRGAYTAQGWPIQAPVLTNVKAQLDKVKSFMEQNKVFVFEDLLNYIRELMSCQFVVDNQGKPTDEIKDEKKFHLCACARYLLSDFKPETMNYGKIRTSRLVFPRV